MSSISSYVKLEDLGRTRLSRNFFVRDFLHSEIAAWNGIRNVPDNPKVLIAVGRRLCEELLEPLQATFGRIHIRSGYRSPDVNDFGNRNGLNCASNASNYAAHIWDRPDASGSYGATACIVIPWLVDRIEQGGRWTEMAWWIHDHLQYSSLCFFQKLAAFNISWHEQPVRRIDSYVSPKGCLTRPGMVNHAGLHQEEYLGFPGLAEEKCGSVAQPMDGDGTELSKGIHERGKAEPDAQRRVLSPAPVANSAGIVPPRIRYRAVHTKTAWRKVNTHRSLEAAIEGKDGAAALFARKVRTNYELHGSPLYVAVWEEGAQHGFVLAPAANGGVRKVRVPIETLAVFEDNGGGRAEDFSRLF